MTNKNYNGWTNWETWNCNLWFDNHFEEDASIAWEATSTTDNLDDRKEVATERLAECIETFVTECVLDKNEESSLAQDFLTVSLREVNWLEIAAHYIDPLFDDARGAYMGAS